MIIWKAENAPDEVLTLGKEIWNQMLPALIGISMTDKLRKESPYLQIGMKEKNHKPRQSETRKAWKWDCFSSTIREKCEKEKCFGLLKLIKTHSQ